MFKTTVSPGSIQAAAATASVAETAGNVTISVTRTGGNAGAVGISYGTSPGTALAGVNYTSTSGNLTWADGDVATKSVTVPILNDGVATGNRVFNVNLSTPTGGAVLGAPASVAVTIQDAQVAPGAPVIGVAQPGDGRATIAFTAPASSGSSPITGYTVSCTPGPITANGSAAVSHIIVTWPRQWHDVRLLGDGHECRRNEPALGHRERDARAHTDHGQRSHRELRERRHDDELQP
jgi:hypothetical protein